MIASGRLASRMRGQPLWALGGIAIGWVALRSVFFEMPAPWRLLPFDPMPMRFVERMVDGAAPGVAPAGMVSRVVIAPRRTASIAAANPWAGRAVSAAPGGGGQPTAVAAPDAPLAAAHDDPLRRLAAHVVTMPAAMAAAVLAGSSQAGGIAAPRVRLPSRRWSADGWLALRAGDGALGPSGGAAPSYGASQAGAVLRYALAPASPLRPQAYARVVHALNGAPEGDLAAGLSLRPLAGVAVTAHGEARLSRRGDRVEVRPAAFLSGGFDDVPLAAGFAARGYGQAGYVGGRGATAFADGSLVADRVLWSHSQGSALAVGAGSWGGVQRGAGRLDLGPTASVRFRLGRGSARLSADYRLRVAGNAEPTAGAALTLSAGF